MTDSQRPPKEVAARDARQGRIILNTRWRIALFVAGLAGMAILAVVGGT